MADPQRLHISPEMRPKPDDVTYDLDRALSSVVSLQALVPDDAYTAGSLGNERAGNGVLIRDDGLVLTIGYLITEAEQVWLIDESEAATAAHVVAYDQQTGLGLVQALGRLSGHALPMGNSADLAVGDDVVVAGHGGRSHAINAEVIAKREFAGYWEYVLDEGIFTAPAHPNWGGTAVIGADGTLRGLGSLYVQQTTGDGEPEEGNMIVPIDLLKPIMDDLLTLGRVNKPPRPWLGMLTTEIDDKLVVASVSAGAPADQADVQVGDVVLGVAGHPVNGLANLFRRVWAQGEAGVTVPLTVHRDGDTLEIPVLTGARTDFLKSPRLH